jgi:HlyD family secretion protein
MTERTSASWLVYVLGALCAGAIVAAILVVGPASGSQATVTRTAKVAEGVVQSTVSGSGNLQAASQLNLGFKTSGTVTNIDVTQGKLVTQGQLLATLDPQSAEVTLEQAKAALLASEANLAKEEETNGETSTGQSSGGSGAGNSSAASAASVRDASSPETAAAPETTSPGAAPTAPTTTTAPASTTPATATTPATTPTSKSPSKPTTTTPTTTSPSRSTTTTREREPKTTEPKETGSGGSSSEGSKQSSSSSSSSSSISSATREANLASARAAVKSDKLTVQSDEEAVQNTKLYAPQDGTIVSLSGQVGETVSGGGTTKASSSASSSSGSGTGAAATGGASATGARSSTTGSSGSSTSSSSSSSSFAVLSDLSSMQLVVPLSESEIGNVKDGQTATVTVEALNGAKLAAHVSEVAMLSTSNSGVVSYDVTFQLDQLASGLKVGMSATAEVVVKQTEGVNVPTSAISADTVTVERAGKQVRQRVVTGLAGNTSTIILSGLKAGETVVLPAASSSTSTSTSSLTSRLGRAGSGALGGGGLGGGGSGFAGGGGGGGGGAFFRGGG